VGRRSGGLGMATDDFTKRSELIEEALRSIGHLRSELAARPSHQDGRWPALEDARRGASLLTARTIRPALGRS
jgi:hypothetical protein